MNSRLVEMIARGRLPFRGGWIDLYNQATNPNVSGTILTTIDSSNNYYVMEEIKPIVSMELSGGVWDKRYGQSRTVYNPDGIAPTLIAGGGGGTETKITEPVVLGWTRDEKGNVVDRHPVDVANAVTAGKRENTQNYVVIPANTADGQQTMELGGVCDLSYPSSKTRRGRVQDGGSVTPTITTHAENSLRRIEPINGTTDGCASTLTGAHFYSGHITNPKGGHKENGVLDGVRIRKLTERECFRLMGVSDADIDTIQAAGISKSQQYKLAGNSIVVNCIAAIFRQMFIGNENKNQQLEIF